MLSGPKFSGVRKLYLNSEVSSLAETWDTPGDTGNATSIKITLISTNKTWINDLSQAFM